ncbi:MAG: ATP phosphoribosyltransferase regulatory subunit [Chitinophagales bacterium]
MKTREVVQGTKDYLPDEASLKRNIEDRTVQTFLQWGYREVITPTFEYLEVIEAGAGEGIREELFLLQDREGRLLALRPEMTIPIARMVSTRMVEEEGPFRLFYNANIFRHTQTQIGRYKEFYQLGVELIDAPGPRADAEVIALAAEILASEGVDFQISLNHIGFFNSLLEQSGLIERDKDEVKKLVAKKDMVGLEKKLAVLPLDDSFREILMKIPVLHGGPEVLETLATEKKIPGVEIALKEFTEVYSLLKCYGIENRIVVDLGVLRGFDYYTGVVFEGYSPDLGYPLLGGGRYDRLLGNFGRARAATGFAIGIERMMLALKGRADKPQSSLLVSGSDLKAVLAKARDLRQEGHVVEVDLSPEQGEQTLQVRPLEGGRS